MRETMDQLSHRGTKVSKQEINNIYASNRKKVYKRPMTAVNPYKHKQLIQEQEKKEFFEEPSKEEEAKEKIKAQEVNLEEEEIYVKEKMGKIKLF